jgi:IclR family acetate operon transcriptional repressor
MRDDPPIDKNPRARGRPRDWHDKTEQNTIKSLDRAIMVLQRLAEMGGTTLSELASDLGQSPATVYRILITLQGRGLVEFVEDGQVWHVGAGAFLIGSYFLRRTSLVERARPEMRALMAATGETANLGIERNGDVLFVSQVETHETIRAFFPPGTLSPMHASGIGKALLAFLPEDRRARVLDTRPRAAFTAHTLTDRAALEADLAEIRARGYAIDAEEKTAGMRCIAAPVHDAFGEPVAGISVSGPTSRVDLQAVPEIAAHVMAAADRLTAALGGRTRGR